MKIYHNDSGKASKVEEPDLSAHYTARDYVSWQWDELVELIRGKIVKMAPSPNTNHQSVVVDICRQLATFFENHPCRTFVAPYDVYLVHPGEDYLDTKNIVEPDFCVVCDEAKIAQRGCIGAPDLMVEVLSPGTAKKDRTVKLQLYEEYLVKEYWMIDPNKRTVYQYFLKENRFEEPEILVEASFMNSKIFPQLKVDLNKVFRHVKEW